MKKVVHLITLLELGGAQGNTIHTVKNLDPQKFETHLWCGQGAFWDNDVAALLGNKNRLRYFPRLVRQIQPLFDLWVIWDLYRALKHTQPDVLHTHSSKAGIVGRIAGYFAGVPVIVHTFHGFGFNNQQKPWTKALFICLEKWTACYTNAFIFVSKANWEEATALNIGDKTRYHMIRSGISIPKLRAIDNSLAIKQVREQFRIPLKHKVVTTISAFKPQKNLTDFLKMAKIVSEKNPDTTFFMIGDGEQRPLLEAMIQKENLSRRVHLTGWLKDPSIILAASDIFVLTSLWEGLPRALLEALVLGKPSVCYKTDGVMDILNKGGGTAIEQKDVYALSEEIAHLLSNESYWLKRSEEAKSMINEEFDIDHMVRQQEKLYERLIHS